MVPGDGQRREHVVERFDLHGRERVSRFVGDRQMGAHPGQSHGCRVRDRRGQAQRLVGGSSDPTHAGVDLQVDGVIAAAGNGNGFELRVGVHGEIEFGTHCLDQLRGRLLAEHQDRAVETGLAQRHTFLHQGDAQPGCSTAKCGPGDRPGAVAVAVGFDHRPHGRRRGDRAQQLDVVPDRVDIDVGPRPAAHSRSSSTAGIKSGRSLATSPCRNPRRPA